MLRISEFICKYSVCVCVCVFVHGGPYSLILLKNKNLIMFFFRQWLK